MEEDGVEDRTEELYRDLLEERLKEVTENIENILRYDLIRKAYGNLPESKRGYFLQTLKESPIEIFGKYANLRISSSNMRKLGDYILQKRSELGITQTELARRMNENFTKSDIMRISRLERAEFKRPIKGSILKKLKEVLGEKGFPRFKY